VLSYQKEALLLEENAFTGTADAVCKAESSMEVTYFSSDCQGTRQQPVAGAGGAGLECHCCTVCCGAPGGDDDDDDVVEQQSSCTSSNLFWKGNLDPTWETGYEREKYDFGEGMFVPQPP
jgi:hypothetical protein